MTMRDIKNRLSVITALEPAATTTNGGRTSGPIDLRGFDSALFAINYGAVATATGVFTPTIFEGDTTNGSFTSVADEDLEGAEADAGLPAAARVDGSTEKVTKTVGYRGVKRYVKINVTPVGTAAAVVGADVVRGHAHEMPVA